MESLSSKDTSKYDQTSFAIGLTLAVLSSVFIGSSFIIKKSGLKRLGNLGYLRAGAGGFRYLKDWVWWLGLIMMGAGEALNFVAYAFAPASLVAPLGALSVLVAAILSSKFLKERLNFLGKLGCFLCVIGSTIIVIHSPKAEEVYSLEELESKLQEPLFLSYLSFILIVSLSIQFYFGPKYGRHNIFVYLLLCSAVGSLTVVFCKGIGISIKQSFTGDTNALYNWLLWVLIFTTVLCIMVQMNYLNKSLDIFNTSLVTPVYYVMFTTLVLIASSILFQEWLNMGAIDVLGSICGFLTVIVGIIMLNTFKDLEVNFKDVYSTSRREVSTPDNGGDTDTDCRIEISYGSTTRPRTAA